jgi:hypothetical protein
MNYRSGIEIFKMILYFLGQIKVPRAMIFISGNPVSNFSEYYRRHMANYGTVPFSIFGVLPPAANLNANGTYGRIANYNGASNLQSNPCKIGNEPQGSLFKVENHAFGNQNGALIFLGGTANDHHSP